MDDEQDIQRWRRFRRLKIDKSAIKKRARKLENVTVRHAHQFITHRWANVRDVARHAAAWLIIIGLLIGLAFFQSLWLRQSYTVETSGAGGTYAEGMIGRLETVNPLYASSSAEVSVSRLVFSGLLDYDQDNELRPNTAKSWKISEDGTVYTVQLRDDVYWHDGKQLTADDVLFTVKLMQNPSVRAMQYGNWAGVKVEKIAKNTIRFTLPSVYAPFAHSLTFGILPQHVLQDVRPVDMRENDFGRQPVGSGPFIFKRLQVIDPNQGRLVAHMEANNRYYRGEPLLNRFQIHTYESYEALERAFRTSEVNAALGLRAAQIVEIVSLSNGAIAPEVRLEDGVYALFNADSQLVSDKALRQALLRGTDRRAVIESVAGRAVPLDNPLLEKHIGMSGKQASYDRKKAEAQLDEIGWKLENGVRKKDGIELALSVIAPDSGDYKTIVNTMVSDWRALGVKITVNFVSTQEIASNYLQPRNYDVLVYEFAIGSDPDVYPYWHSSQAKPAGLNFANYRSGLADDALSSARARLDTSLRAAKYRAFADQWRTDTPAIALYQPFLSYVKSSDSTSLTDGVSVADPTVRYRDIERWAVSRVNVMKTP